MRIIKSDGCRDILPDNLANLQAKLYNHSYINSRNCGCGDFFSSLSKFRHFFRRISEIGNVGDLMHVHIGSSWPRLILWNIWKTTEQMPLQTLQKTLKDKFETIILLRLCYVFL